MKTSRKLQVRLPADHPVWSFPEGERSAMVRELIDLGLRLTAVEKRLAAVEEELRRLASRAGGAPPTPPPPPGDDVEKFRRGLAMVFD